MAVQYSVKHATESAANMVERWGRVCSDIERLASALDKENERIIDRCHIHVAKVLRAFSQPKHIALMRELQLVAQLQDAAAPIGLVLGLPMLGQAAPVRGLMQRYHPPLASIAQWESDRVARNKTVLDSIRSSRDIDLDRAAFEKSLAERDRGVLLRPFEVGEDLGIGDVCYVPRRGIWELHGGAIEPSCRVIDDLLFGEQNSTVERFSSHRPTDVDGLAAQVRAVATRFPQRAISGWP